MCRLPSTDQKDTSSAYDENSQFACPAHANCFGTYYVPCRWSSDSWTFRWLAYVAQGLHRWMITIFPCGSRRSKGVPSGRDVFLRLLVGELGPPNFPKFSPMANGYIYAEWYHGASDLDQRCLKMRNSEDGCTFPPNIFAPTPKSPQNPVLGDLSMQSLLYTELSVSRTLTELYEAETLQLHRYRQVLGGMGCVKIFPLGASGAGRANANLGPPYYLGNYWS